MSEQVHSPNSGAPHTTVDASVVSYELTVSQVPDEFEVTSFHAVEELNRTYTLTVHVFAVHEATDCSDMLGRDAHVTIARGSFNRRFDGIVSRVTVLDNGELRQSARIEIVPALAALRLSKTSRIFQEMSALEIIASILAEELQRFSRTHAAEVLDPSRYLTRDFCVQYQETNLDFVHRLMEEEGIGYYFTHEDPERLMLFENNAGMQPTTTIGGGPIRYDPTLRSWTGSEPIVRFTACSRLVPTRLQVHDQDWTRRRAALDESSGDADSEDAGRHASEVYEHGFAHHATIHEEASALADLLGVASASIPVLGDFGIPPWIRSIPAMPIERFTETDLTRQAALRYELLRRDRERFAGMSVVSHLSPGHTFELSGHPTLGLDGEYFLTKIVHSSELGRERFADYDASNRLAEADLSGNYHNRFECLPVGTPWRPARVSPKPRIYGIQTATVTGPLGLDVHTDHLGRVKVRFAWDRSEEVPKGDYTCWLRVSQAWAGQGSPGIMFIPRIGMEVVVSFIDGDPDRPLITGCVYNGANQPPEMLPLQATRSVIRTRTVPHGPGYNELSFEDAMGKEQIHIRAERDLDEVVMMDHQTEVKRDRASSVGRDEQRSTGRTLRLNVGRDQEAYVARDARITTGGHHAQFVGLSASLHVERGHSVQVEGTSTSHTRGRHSIVSEGPLVLQQAGHNYVVLSGDESEGPSGVLIETEGASILVSDDKIEMKVGSCSFVMTPEKIQANGKTFPSAPGSIPEEPS